MLQFLSLALLLSAVLNRFLTRVAGSDQTTGMILVLLRQGMSLIPVELLLVALDLQDGGVVVQDGQDDFVHVLSQTYVDFFLFLQSFH